jgi:CO/xanthine dehydrogenase FAD-binding subunit
MTGVTFLQPATWTEALEARAAHPEAVPVAGGTDVLVEVNLDRRHPAGLLDLDRVGELRALERVGDQVRIGAGVTYSRLIERLAGELPALAAAARTVGSPPIRNRGTIGGNLGSASPAGDCHPPLLASGAELELASARGSRTVAASAFFTGPKRSVLGPDELISAAWVPVADGPQAFAKVGTRNAMVIAVCSLAVALHPRRGTVGTGIGSAGPVPLAATAAEELVAGHLAETAAWERRGALPEDLLVRFGELVAEAARPIDDLRGTAAYRQHALSVLARRLLTWCWDDYRSGAWEGR